MCQSGRRRASPEPWEVPQDKGGRRMAAGPGWGKEPQAQSEGLLVQGGHLGSSFNTEVQLHAPKREK